MSRTRFLRAGILACAGVALSAVTAFAGPLDEINRPIKIEDNAVIRAVISDPPVGILYAVRRTDATVGIKDTCKAGFMKDGFQGNEGLCGALLAHDALNDLQDMVERFKCSDTAGKEITYSIGHQSFWPDTTRAPIVFAETSEVTCEENPGQTGRGVIAGKADRWQSQCVENDCSAVFKPSKSSRAYFYVPNTLTLKPAPKIDLGE